jgi:hypothetical protein
VVIEETGHVLTRGGDALSFWTEGSVGPVFFVEDEQATVLGHLSHGGEAAFAVRAHEGWTSVYLSMINFGPQLLRNLAIFAGAHIWCTSDDVLYANQSLVCLHSAAAGRKLLSLPAPAYVRDLWTGERTAHPVTSISLEMPAFRTQAWRTEY